jgi:uncharacterized NAD(P)/FAD-binding protein YdhS
MSLAESVVSGNAAECPPILLMSGNARPGPGFAFGTSCNFHKINTPSALMSVVPSHGDDFLVWLGRARDRNQGRRHAAQLDNDYLPRPVYARYLMDRFTQAVDLLRRKGVPVDVVREPATELRVSDGKVELRSRQSQWIRPRWLVYAPGHPALPNFPDLESSPFFTAAPFASDALSHAKATDRVAVLGMGLTAIDVIMQLLGNGFRGKIDCYSRNALLPTVQSRIARPDIVPQHLAFERLLMRKCYKGRLTLSELLARLSLDLRAFPENESVLAQRLDPTIHHGQFLEALLGRARTGDLPLQAILQATRSYAHKAWQWLSDDERMLFLHQIQRTWDVWRYAIPYETASSILENLRSGQLTVKHLSGRRSSDTGIVLESPEGYVKHRWVVDGTGGHGWVTCTRDPFLSKALKLGVFQASVFGGLALKGDTLRAKTSRDITTEIYLLGQIAKGDLFSTNALWFNRQCAQQIADNVVNRRTAMAA